MNRGLSALQKIKILCDSYQVDEILAYATSAIREAENGGVFIQRSIDQVGIKFEQFLEVWKPNSLDMRYNTDLV